MTKEVMVTISGLHMADGEEQEPIELVHVGEYYERNGTHYILYDEVLEGIPQPVRNVVKIKDRCLEIQKKGPVSVNMLFEEGRSQSSTYSIPYGSFLMQTRTDSVTVQNEEEKMEVSAVYVLEINGEHIADCNIRILIESREHFRL